MKEAEEDFLKAKEDEINKRAQELFEKWKSDWEKEKSTFYYILGRFETKTCAQVA